MKISGLAMKKEKLTLNGKLFIGRYNIAYHIALPVMIHSIKIYA